MICSTRNEWQDAVVAGIPSASAAVRAQLAALEARVAEANACACELRALADATGAAGAAHCDVLLKCADGVELSASRFLLVQTCPYYRSLFESGGTEVGGVIAADASFSSSAHAALLRQLHSLGEANLPEEADGLLELLKLAAKLQPPAGVEGQEGTANGIARATQPLERVIARCESAIIGGLDVSNCLDVLLHVKALNSFPRIVGVAEALVKSRLREVVAQPRWAAFAREFPHEAVELMTSVAVQLSHDLDETHQPKRQRLD